MQPGGAATPQTQALSVLLPSAEPVAPSGWDTLSRAADFATLVGLALTILTFMRLRKIQSTFLFQARTPELLASLRTHGSRISELLRDFKTNKHDLHIELGQCLANIDSLRTKLPGDPRKTATQLAKQIRAIRKPRKDMNESDVWAMYSELNVLIQRVQNLEADLKWRPADG